jgi:hypothetical protein
VDQPNLALVGIHAATQIVGETHYAIEILVGHHLRLLADEVPEIRGELLKRFPDLMTWM